MAKIKKTDFNLNISRYICTAVADIEIDLAATHQDLLKSDNDIAIAKKKLERTGLEFVALRRPLLVLLPKM